MLFQLTTAGRALINSDPMTPVTKIDFGSGYGYAPAGNPTGLQGSVVYTSNVVFSPVAVNANTMRYTAFLASPIGPFTFGEIAIWSNATLIGVGASATQIVKNASALGNEYRIDVFVDLLNGQNFASAEAVSSNDRNFFPRLSSPDLLPNPTFESVNAYLIYESTNLQSSSLAFADPNGRWSFTNRPRVFYTGLVDSVSTLGMQSDDLLVQLYNGPATNLLVQFVSGAYRGTCRVLASFNAGGLITWSSALTGLPQVGDQFVIMGPSGAFDFDGDHNDLLSLQGGSSTERYHLTAAQQDRVANPRRVQYAATASPFPLVEAHNQGEILVTADRALTLDSSAWSAFPIGGSMLIRTADSLISFTLAGSTTVGPAANIPTVKTNGLYMLSRRTALDWDLVPLWAEPSAAAGTDDTSYTTHLFKAATDLTTAPKLTTDGAAVGTSNGVRTPNNSVVQLIATIVAQVASTHWKTWRVHVTVRNAAGAMTILEESVEELGNSSGNSDNWNVAAYVVGGSPNMVFFTLSSSTPEVAKAKAKVDVVSLLN